MIAEKIFPNPQTKTRLTYDGPMPPSTVEDLKNYMKARFEMSGSDTLRLLDTLRNNPLHSWKGGEKYQE